MKSLNFPGLPRVLVIDDEEGIREGLRSMLQAEGVAVETAASAEDGVRRVMQKGFDIVFLDLNLPGADGLSILSSLRHGSPPPDIVILTGYGTIANTVEAMRKGGAKVFQLPLAETCAKGTFIPPTMIEIRSLAQLQREVFGPVLHVLRFAARDLARVVDEINATGYGLTLGIHSRIDETINDIVARAHVGNTYVNRNMIGAVVGVQPFGGEGRSGTGPKAGGPFYMPRFATERVRSTDITATGGNVQLLGLGLDSSLATPRQ